MVSLSTQDAYVAPGLKGNYPGFTPADISAVIWIPGVGAGPIYLGRIEAITISSHRDKFPVVALGREHVKGYVRGPRMVAGSLSFATLDAHGLWEAVEIMRGLPYMTYGRAELGFRIEGLVNRIQSPLNRGVIHADELPPFDVLITLINEQGDAAYTAVRGVEIIDSAQMFSVENPELKGSMSYMAREYVPMQPITRTSALVELERSVARWWKTGG